MEPEKKLEIVLAKNLPPELRAKCPDAKDDQFVEVWMTIK